MSKLISEDCFRVRKLNIYKFSLKRLSHILLCDCALFYTLTICEWNRTENSTQWDFSVFKLVKKCQKQQKEWWDYKDKCWWDIKQWDCEEQYTCQNCMSVKSCFLAM